MIMWWDEKKERWVGWGGRGWVGAGMDQIETHQAEIALACPQIKTMKTHLPILPQAGFWWEKKNLVNIKKKILYINAPPPA